MVLLWNSIFRGCADGNAHLLQKIAHDGAAGDDPDKVPLVVHDGDKVLIPDLSKEPPTEGGSFQLVKESPFGPFRQAAFRIAKSNFVA